jgi:hypothetical protein
MMEEDSRIDQVAFIVGMPRAGTTFLYHNLQKHPQLFVPYRRKTNYFSLHKEKSVSWFLDHFKGIKKDQIAIDTETLFFIDKSLKSFEEIYKYNNSAKALLFVRQPSDWVLSLYKQIATFDKNIISFEKFLNNEYALIEDDVEITFNMKDGDIEKTITSLMDTFKGNLLIVDFRLLENDPLRMLNEVEIFLGLKKFFGSDNFEKNKINSRNRGHISALAFFLRNGYIIKFLKFLPRPLVILIRRLYDWVSSRFGKDKEIPESSYEMDLAIDAFKNDNAYVENLFKEKNVFKL